MPITVAPVFFCAAIYVQLTRLYDSSSFSNIQSSLIRHLSINSTNRKVSRFNPRFITFVFVPCDIISLVLQGVGGALSAGAETIDETKVGVDVSKAGLIFQVITLAVFITLSTDYLLALKRSHRKSATSLKKPLKTMVPLLSAATMLILARCLFRIYELKDGYFAPAFRDEPTFIALESA